MESDRIGERLLSAPEVAEKLGVKLGTVYSWRKRKIGPPAVRLGDTRTLRYRESDIDKWLIQQLPETDES